MVIDATAGIEPGNSLLFDNRLSFDWITTAQAAAYLKISQNALRIMVHRGLIKAHKLGSRLRFRLPDLKACLHQKRS